ncbi:hypothetical protein FB451DRAFT_1567105 [Mycena latifolia]|nr:hypothetical protein FB451DRAFT_1567105 [Mycena latifolia]
MKFTICLLLPFIAAVVATPTVSLDARLPNPCSGQLRCTDDPNFDEAISCIAQGYTCPGLGAPVLAPGNAPNATCAANCDCEEPIICGA